MMWILRFPSTVEKGKTIKDLSFNYTIRRSQRAKKTRIIVTSNKIEVVAPLRVSERQIHAFVESQQDWVVSATNRLEAKKQNINKLAPEKYSDGVTVPFQGKQSKLILKSSSSNNVQIEFYGQEFNIFLPYRLIEDSNELIRFALIDWMKKQALNAVESYVDLHAKKYKLYPRYIRIKTQKSRWGSCGIHNDINLNWLLILAPSEVLEYVVVHELCHIKERNHSVKFWRLVAAHLPDYQKQRNWLKQNGACIMQGL